MSVTISRTSSPVQQWQGRVCRLGLQDIKSLVRQNLNQDFAEVMLVLNNHDA